MFIACAKFMLTLSHNGNPTYIIIKLREKIHKKTELHVNMTKPSKVHNIRYK